jgi:hypothetical protein
MVKFTPLADVPPARERNRFTHRIGWAPEPSYVVASDEPKISYPYLEFNDFLFVHPVAC